MKNHKLEFVAVGLCAFLSTGYGAVAESAPPRSPDALVLAPEGAVRFTGWWGETLSTCRSSRIDGQDLPALVAPFATRPESWQWKGEFWGKWYTSAVLAERYQPDPKLRGHLTESAQALIATQSADGAITTYKREPEFSNWDTWGRKYTLLGLLAAHDMTGDPAILAAACRHADRILQHYGPDEANILMGDWWNGLAFSSILEPMVQLYRRTGEERYLRFARYIVSTWESGRGPDLVRKAIAGVPVYHMLSLPDPTKKGYFTLGSSKAYEMMSCYEGVAELYRTTGEARYLEAVRKVYDNIRDTEITILGSGSSLERWCNGRARQAEPVVEWMETCVAATWVKFGAQLLRLTGDSGYADDIELAAYNALVGAQKPDGTWWCHYSPLEGERKPAPEQCGMHMNCCVASGPRALFLLPALAGMTSREGVTLNFFEPGTMTLPTPAGKRVRLDVASDYPRPGPVVITVAPEAAEQFTLAVRIPRWSRTAALTVNGEAVAKVEPGTYARIQRTWAPGDRVELQLDFAARRMKDPGPSSRVAVMRGPVVFALDRRLASSVAGAGGGVLLADENGVVSAHDGRADFAHLVLEVPFEGNGRRFTLPMCDYASAGATWNKDSTLRVWLPQPLDLADPFADVQRPELPK